MRYFKAIKIEDMPLIQWASWANDEDELKQINDEEKKLINFKLLSTKIKIHSVSE